MITWSRWATGCLPVYETGVRKHIAGSNPAGTTMNIAPRPSCLLPSRMAYTVIEIETIAEFDEALETAVRLYRDVNTPMYVNGSHAAGIATISCGQRAQYRGHTFDIRATKVSVEEWRQAMDRLDYALLVSGNIMVGPQDVPYAIATHRIMLDFRYSEHVVTDHCYMIADDHDAFLTVIRLGGRLEKL